MDFEENKDYFILYVQANIFGEKIKQKIKDHYKARFLDQKY